MKTQEQINYDRIAIAIGYIQDNFKNQPSLEEIAEKVHLSPFHFQKLFTDWAGVSPKKFLQFISVKYAKKILSQENSLTHIAHETGLSGSGRLHDLFVNIEGMTPGEYKNKGANTSINYTFYQSKFGLILIASTIKGICHISFVDEKSQSLSNLKQQFPNAVFTNKSDAFQENAIQIYTQDWSKLNEIKLHLKGSDFQLKVWEALLKIPMGSLATYGDIAKEIGNPNAARAVGTAIGNNPIAFLIPCHRVIQSSGLFGGYMWGTTRKTAIIGWEVAQTSTATS